MPNSIEMAKNRLYGANGLMVADIKLFHGESVDVTPNQRAEQVNKILAHLDAGDFDVVTQHSDNVLV